MLLDDVAFVTVTLFVVGLWWVAKRIAVRADSATIWDASDLVFGLLGGIGWGLCFLTFTAYKSAGPSGPSLGLVALRRMAIGVYSLSVVFWLASIAIEVETDIDTPPSMTPIEERFWEQFSWVPIWPGPPEGDGDA